MLKNKKGITLVELLIVVVILGIIAAISIPAVGNIVQNAQRDTVLADAANIRNAANLCITSGECTVESTGDTTLTSTQLSEFIDVDYDDFWVLYVNGNFSRVAIDTGDWYFVGDPRDAGRTWVAEDEPDDWPADWDDEELTWPAPTEPE